MTDTAVVPRDAEPPAERPVVDRELADQLLARAEAQGVELLGPEGLLSQVTRAVLERALAEELTEHLGYDRHDPAGRGWGNSGNGRTPKTLLTEVGAVELEVLRDRNGSFAPRIVRKGQTRLEGVQRPHRRPLRPWHDHGRRVAAARPRTRALARPDRPSAPSRSRSNPHFTHPERQEITRSDKRPQETVDRLSRR
jgi:hypothetical protein